MNDTEKMVEAILTYAEAHREISEASHKEVATALAHSCVIYAFATKKKNASDEEMREALIGLFTASVDHMIGALQNEKA